MTKKTITTYRYDENGNVIEQATTESLDGYMESPIVMGDYQDVTEISIIDIICTLSGIFTIIAAITIIIKCVTMG